MLEAIKHGLKNLLNLKGRDARQAFWYYVLFVYLMNVVISMALVIPLMLKTMFSAIQQGTMQGQDPFAAQAALIGQMSEIMPRIVWIGFALNLVMALLLAASFVRRLHDFDLSGLWAFIPAVCQIAALALLPAQLGQMQSVMANMHVGGPMTGFTMMQGQMGGGTLLGWIGILTVIALGVRKSSPGPNRFGDTQFVA